MTEDAQQLADASMEDRLPQDNPAPLGSATSEEAKTSGNSGKDKPRYLYCDPCNYNLSGLTASEQDEKGKLCIRCPECGHLQPADSRLKRPPGPWQQFTNRYMSWIFMAYFSIQIAAVGGSCVCFLSIWNIAPDHADVFFYYVAIVIAGSFLSGLHSNFTKPCRRLAWERCLLVGVAFSVAFLIGAIAFMPLASVFVPQGTDPYSLLLSGTFLGLLGSMFIAAALGAILSHQWNALLTRFFAKLEPWLDISTPWVVKKWIRLRDWINRRPACK